MANRTEIEKLDELIKDSIEGELIEQHAESLLPPGENYGSVMYKVDFKVRTPAGEIRSYHAVAKCTPLNQVTQEMFNTQETFKAEIGWYTTVIPTLKKYAEEEGLERDLDFFQEYYGARISLDPESTVVDLDGTILTQNLKPFGYHNIDRHIGFDEKITRSVLTDLAAFHAVSLAIRRKNVELFNEKLKPFCPKFGVSEGEQKQMFDKILLEVFKHIPEVDQYSDRISEAIKQNFPFRQREIREPWVTIMHMDFWCNNIMITGGEKNKNIILDLQVPMIGSPAGDVIFFLLTSVEFKTIQEKLDEFLRFYFDEFIKYLKQLKIDTSLFDFEEFLKEVDFAMKTAEFGHSIGHIQVILGDKGKAAFESSDAEFTHEKMAEAPPQIPNERQREKCKWVVLEAIKRNWI